MSLADWQEYELRERTAEWVATQIACREWEARKARRQEHRRQVLHWCNPFVQVVSDVGRQR